MTMMVSTLKSGKPEKHLHRYLAEFDFRYNNRVALGVDDETRAMKMVKGAQGRRLTYRTTDRDGA